MKYIMSTVVLLATTMMSHACDRCSLMPVGMKYRYNSGIGLSFRQSNLNGFFPTLNGPTGYRHLEHSNNIASGQYLEESYATVAIQGIMRLNDRLHLEGQFTYAQNQRRIEDELSQSAQGISDPMVAVVWTPFSTISAEEHKFSHQLSIGGGVKFPLGNTRVKYEGEAVIHDPQPGTGSYDFIGVGRYLVKYWHLGAQFEVTSELNTTNLSEYRYGNVVSPSLDLVGFISAGDWQLYPMAGVFADKVWSDVDHAEKLTNSSGSFYGIGAGMEIIYQNVSVSGKMNWVTQQEHDEFQLDRANEILISLKYLIKTRKS